MPPFKHSSRCQATVFFFFPRIAQYFHPGPHLQPLPAHPSQITPSLVRPEPKRRFVPTKWEAKKMSFAGPWKTPVVLIPGISGGLWCYVLLIRQLLRQEEDRACFIV